MKQKELYQAPESHSLVLKTECAILTGSTLDLDYNPFDDEIPWTL